MNSIDNNNEDYKIGIAVSVYDKFDDLAILHDIIRENWNQEYYLAVCCSHPNGREELLDKRNLDIDEYLDGSEIEFCPNNMEGKQRGIHLHSRIANQIKKSCKACAMNSNYVMHVHADAWPLKEDKLNTLVDEMDKKSKKAAFKGPGPTYRTYEFRIGLASDMFLVFDSNYALENEVFEFNPLEIMPDANIETTVMLLLFGKIGWSNVYNYSDSVSDTYWDGKPLQKPRVNPCIYDQKYNLLHCDRNQVPKKLGKSLQAIFLEKNKLEKGENIKKLRNKHLKSSEAVFNELNKIERQMDIRLKLLGFDMEGLGRNFGNKETRLNMKNSKKIIYALKNYFEIGYYKLNRILFHILPKEVLTKERNIYKENRSANILPNSEYPQTYKNLYQLNVDREKMPKNLELWFENSKD